MEMLQPMVDRACELNEQFARDGREAVIRYLRMNPMHPVADEQSVDVIVEMPPYGDAGFWSNDILKPIYSAIEQRLGKLMPVGHLFCTPQELQDPANCEGVPVPERVESLRGDTRHLTLSVDKALADQAQTVADAQSTTLSSVMRTALAEHVQRRRRDPHFQTLLQRNVEHHHELLDILADR